MKEMEVLSILGQVLEAVYSIARTNYPEHGSFDRSAKIMLRHHGFPYDKKMISLLWNFHRAGNLGPSTLAYCELRIAELAVYEYLSEHKAKVKKKKV